MSAASAVTPRTIQAEQLYNFRDSFTFCGFHDCVLANLELETEENFVEELEVEILVHYDFDEDDMGRRCRRLEVDSVSIGNRVVNIDGDLASIIEKELP